MTNHELLDTALTGEPVKAIPAIRDLRQKLEQAEHDHIITIRRHGGSWAFIARQLHVTRSAVHQKYAHWDPPTTT